MDLAEFLLARFADDEAIARAEVDRLRGAPRRGFKTTAARRLAECEAKRRIVERYQRFYATRKANWMNANYAGAMQELGDVLKDLALPFADHPDFLPEWLPEETQ